MNMDPDLKETAQLVKMPITARAASIRKNTTNDRQRYFTVIFWYSSNSSLVMCSGMGLYIPMGSLGSK